MEHYWANDDCMACELSNLEANGIITFSPTTQHIKSLVADYIFKIYGEVPSDKLWDELWEKVKDKEVSGE